MPQANSKTNRKFSDDEAQDIVSIVTSKTLMHRILGQVGADEKLVDRIIDKVKSYRDVLEQEKEAERQRLLNIEKNRERALKLLKDLDLDPEDLMKGRKGRKTSTKSTSNRGPRPGTSRPRAIYRVEDREGNPFEIESSIAGRAPKALADYMERTGKTREDCEIERFDPSERQKEEENA